MIMRRRPVRHTRRVKTKKGRRTIIVNKDILRCPKVSKKRGGLSDGMHDNRFSMKSILEGAKVELEHTSNICTAKDIAKDHLAEHRGYYPALKEMEDRLERQEKKRKRKNQRGINLIFEPLPEKDDEAFSEVQHLKRAKNKAFRDDIFWNMDLMDSSDPEIAANAEERLSLLKNKAPGAYKLLREQYIHQKAEEADPSLKDRESIKDNLTRRSRRNIMYRGIDKQEMAFLNLKNILEASKEGDGIWLTPRKDLAEKYGEHLLMIDASNMDLKKQPHRGNTLLKGPNKIFRGDITIIR